MASNASLAQLQGSLGTLEAGIQTMIWIVIGIQLLFTAIAFGLWLFIRKKENLHWAYALVSFVVVFLAGGLLGIIGAAGISLGYAVITRKAMDVTNLAKYFALSGGIIGVVLLMLNIVLVLLFPEVLKAAYGA